MIKRIKFSGKEIYFILQSISLRTSECRALLDECQFSSGTHASVSAALRRWLSISDKLKITLPNVDYELTDEESSLYSRILDF